MAVTMAHFRCATDLLNDFNAEYDDPVTDPQWRAQHFAALVAGVDTSVLLTGEPTSTPRRDDEAVRHLDESFGFDCHEGRGEGPLAVYYERVL